VVNQFHLRVERTVLKALPCRVRLNVSHERHDFFENLTIDHLLSAHRRLSSLRHLPCSLPWRPLCPISWCAKTSFGSPVAGHRRFGIWVLRDFWMGLANLQILSP